MNESEEQEENIKMPKVTFKNLAILSMILLFLLGFAAGRTLGYREAYTYVANWYVDYMDRSCICYNETETKPQLGIPNYIDKLDIIIEPG